MKSAIRKCALLLMTFTVWAKPALARSYLARIIHGGVGFWEVSGD